MTSASIYAATTTQFSRKTRLAIAAPLVVLAYFAYICVSFDVAGLSQRINLDNARTLVSDSYSYKTHVQQDNRNGAVTIAVEGERKGQYPEGMAPDWVTLGEETIVDLGEGNVVTLGPQVRYDIPGYGLVTARPDRSGVHAAFPAGDLPDYINASKNRVMIATDAGRLTITARVRRFSNIAMAGNCSFSHSTAPITAWGRCNCWTVHCTARQVQLCRTSGPTRCGGMAMYSGHCLKRY